MKHCRRQILMWFCCGVCLFAYGQHTDSLGRDTSSATLNRLLNAIAESASDSSLVVIGDISVHGNKKTKPYIIERELPFKQGDYLVRKDLEKNLLLAQERVMNSALFTQVLVYVQSQQGNVIFINVDVKERWYLFPLPYFKLVDRNFNQWWVEQKASINRVNYGIKFNQNNVTGRNDKLNIYLIGGYSRQILLKYEQPFADKALKNGYSILFNLSRQRELNYGTELNKQSFYKQDNFVMQNMRIEASYLYRPAIKTRHSLLIGYVRNKVSDTILHLNPHYFPDTLSDIISYPEIAYSVRYFDADYNAYPTKGLIADGAILRRGLGGNVNLTQFQYHANIATPLNKKLFILFQSAGMIKLPFDQPFYNQQLFGYGDAYLRGLEYYVMDGVAGILGRATLHQQVFAMTLRTPPHYKREVVIPMKFYVKAGGDFGYVYSRAIGNSLLSNKPVYTETVGLDMVIPAYDVVFKFNYSFNQLGQSGFFFHVRTDF